MKSLSQNFLIDKNIIRKILDVAHIQKDDFVLEIGPGKGALTKPLLEKGARVRAIEIDTNLLTDLKELQAEFPQLEVIHGDILEFPCQTLFPKKGKVVANLPYHITTPILTKLLPMYTHISTMTVMVQKEYAARLSSIPNGIDYSSITLFCQCYGKVCPCFPVSRHCFFPKPLITSSVIHITPQTPPLADTEMPLFHAFVRTGFSKRRKMLSNALSTRYDPNEVQNALKKLNLNPKARAETLSLTQFLSLFSYLRSECKQRKTNPS